MATRLPEPRWLPVVGNLLFIGFVTLATLPAYMLMDANWRPLVVRSAAALVVAVLLRQVHKAVVGRVQADHGSPFDAALTAPDLQSLPDRDLLELDALVKWSVRSRRYFERIGWPRIAAVAGSPPSAPRSRRFGYGPSLESLGQLIDTSERSR